ncbi:MAG: glycogen debranching enzyme N-terminal domain-containing protein [Nitrospirota bacterium]
MISFGQDSFLPLERAVRREWVATNGRGAYCAASVLGANTRREHGLLVVPGADGKDRVLLSAISETISSGGQEYDLSTRFYPDAVFPEGYKNLRRFSRYFFPTFTFVCGTTMVVKTILMLHGEETVVIQYTVHARTGPATLTIEPFAACREAGELSREREGFRWEEGRVVSDRDESVWFYAPGFSFAPEPCWNRRVAYPADAGAGEEDLFRPGRFTATVEGRAVLAFVASAGPREELDVETAFLREIARRDALLERASARDDVERELVLAADQFILRDSEGTLIRTGYYARAETGAETLAAAPGLLLATGRYEEMKDLLIREGGRIRSDPFPRLPGGSGTFCADGPLWFALAGYLYAGESEDAEFVRRFFLPILDDIVDLLATGVGKIRMGGNGLLEAAGPDIRTTCDLLHAAPAGAPAGAHLPVDLSLLWYSVLRGFVDLADRSRWPGRGCSLLAEKVRLGVNKEFWNDAEGCLAARIENGEPVLTVTPCQLLAVTLPFRVLPGLREQRLVTAVHRLLVAPVGLWPRPHGGGNDNLPHKADATTSFWGTFLSAYLTAFGGEPDAEAVVSLFLEPLGERLREGMLGCLPSAYREAGAWVPAGRPAYALAVAEVLSAKKRTSARPAAVTAAGRTVLTRSEAVE